MAVTELHLRPTPDPVLQATHVVDQKQAAAAVPPSSYRAPEPRPSLVSSSMEKIRESRDWEAIVGGRWLNRIGAFALVLGLVLFFKYAIDKNYIGHSLQVAIGVVLGLGLLAIAYRTHKKGLQIFSQGLVGAGVASLYISVFAGYNIYHLLDPLVALVAMFVITAVAFEQAWQYDSIAISVLAWAGGFLVALIEVATASHPNEVGLFIYVLLLAAGILAVVWKKESWAILEPLTFAATFGTYLVYVMKDQPSTSADWLTTAILLTTLWAAFYVFDVVSLGRRTSGSLPVLHQVLAVINGIVYYCLLYALLAPGHYSLIAPATLCVAAVYIATTVYAVRQAAMDEVVIRRYAWFAIALVVLAPAIQLPHFTTAAIWAAEALALTAMGVRWNRQYLWGPALLIYGLSLIMIASTPQAFAVANPGAYSPVFSGRAMAWLTLSITVAAGAVLFHIMARRNGQEKINFFNETVGKVAAACETGLILAAWGLFLTLLTVETNDLFRHLMSGASTVNADRLGYDRFLAISLIWMVYGAALVWSGLRFKLLPVLWPGMATAGASILLAMGAGLAFFPIASFTPVLNVRAATLALILAGTGLLMLWVDRQRAVHPALRQVYFALQAGAIFVGLELVSVEVNDYFRHRAAGAAITAEGLFVDMMLLAAIWVLYSLPLMWWGTTRNNMVHLVSAMGIAGTATISAALEGAFYQPAQWVGAILGLRAAVMLLVVGGLLVSLQWMRQATSIQRWLEQCVPVVQALTVLLGFELITVELRDIFSYLGSQQSTAGALDLVHNLEPLALATAWILYGIPLMWQGAKRNNIVVMVGAIGTAAMATLSVAVEGIVYQPTQSVGVILTVRGAVTLLVVGGLIVSVRWMRQAISVHPWLEQCVPVFQAAIVLLGFELITTETRDIFSCIARQQSTGKAADRVRNLEQLALSLAWLVYAVGLICFGIWRRLRWLRLAAMVLFAFIIVKIFAYDLRFLTAAIRYISFAVLGVILLGVSYLYQRYKSILLEPARPRTPPAPLPH